MANLYSEHLFIGGPCDGQRHEVAEGQSTVVLRWMEPVRSDRSPDSLSIQVPYSLEVYLLRRIRFSARIFSFYVHEAWGNLEPDEIFHRLIEGYRQGLTSSRGAHIIPLSEEGHVSDSGQRAYLLEE